MSIKKNNTYFKENDGKIYYYDENGEKKYVPSTAFSNLQEQIDSIGKPLTYSGSKSVTEINELEETKIGTVYTITGEAGNITAGNVDVIQGDEIAWGGDPAQWFNIGKDKVDSWKIWSEEHGSSGVDGSVYIGKNNSADYIGINIGVNNQILNGDDTLGASINLGKNLTNRYGVLIGQNIESSGYGIGLGDNIKSVNAGDTIIGTQIYTNSGRNGKLSWDAYSRTLVGRYLSGYYTYDASVFGSYICAFSGIIPNRASQNEWGYGIGYGSIVIGTHIKGGAQYGSMIIAQNGQDADIDQYNNVVPIVANYDSTIIGGYSNNNYDQTGYYRNPGISAYCNGFILGQGQQMTANYNSIIVGQQSIAIDGSKVFGTHGYARGASMVINPSPMSYNSQSVTVAHINGIALTSAPEIYGSYTAEGVLKRVNGSYSAEKIKLSGDRIHRFNRTPIYYWTIFHKTNATNENSSFVAFNLTGDGWLNQVNGYWNSDKTVFTPNASYGYNAVRINWTRGALLLRVENGEKKLYEYNENTSGTVNFPQYADYYYTGYPNWNTNYFYTNPNTEDYCKYTTPNSMLLNNIVTDGKFIYKLPGYDFNGGYTTWSYVTGYIPTSFSGSQGYEASATYYYSDGNVYTFPKDVTAYGFNGVTGQISTTTSSVYPSAVFDVSSMITNSTANYGSIAIGQKNSAYGGSIAINTQSQSSNNGWTAQHSLTYINNKYENKNFYCFTEDSTSISITSKSEPNLPTYRSAGFDISGDAQNLAQGASVAIGIGTKGGWKNSAYNESLVIGSKSTAVNNSFVLGRCASAYEHAFAFGHSNGCTAGYQSYSLGGNGCVATGHSYAFGHDGISAENHSYVFGTHGVYAENNGFAFGGQGITARNQGIALGFYGVQAENIDSNDNGYGQGWGIAIGSNGVTSKNGGIAFGYNGVYSENKGCIAIGSSGVNANGSPSIAIGAFGTYAYNWGLSLGAKGRASNQSINFSMGVNSSYTTAENGSINMLAATNNCNTNTNTKSITIKASNNGYASTQYGSISINANTEGWFGTTANNQSIILATKNYSGEDYSNLGSYNNSIIFGAGILNTSASNDSISIGGGKFIDNNSYSQQIYNGSVAIGYGNTANGGVFVQGSRNLLGTTYTSFDNRPIDYTQSIVFGDSNTAYNYRPYLWANKTAYSGDKYISAYISTDSKKTPHGNGSATYTKNMIVGNFNYVVGYNSFTFGLNNTAGCPEYNYNQSTDMISGDKNDDGFTFVFGLNNYARRNYDMAIGFGTSASGGENIAIGTLINGSRGTEAIGYKNISIRSVLSGIGNIGIEAIPSITASGSYNNVFKNVTACNINVHQNVADNILYNVNSNSFISTGTYGEFNRNIFNSLRGTNLNADGGIDRNIIRYTDSDNFGFSSNFTDNIINYSRNSQLGGGEMNKNILWNTDNLKVVATQINDNILLDIGNKSSYDKTNISLYQLQDNIIRKSSLINSLTSNGGVIDKNFLLNSVVSLSGNNQGKGIADGHWNTDAYVTNSFIVGTVTMGSVGESFSFGGMGLDYNVSNTDGVYRFGNNTRYNPILQHVQQTFNFGDNTIVNTQSVITEGCGNEIYGAENSRILGETNGIVSNCCNHTWEGWNGNGNNVMEATIIGTCNFMGQYSAGSTFTNNTLIGQSNDITLNNIIPDTYPSVTNNTLIGSYNAQLEVYEDLISFAIENGIYNYFNSAGHDSKYNILNAPGNYDGISFGVQMSGYGLTGQSNRNVILGNHSVIGSNINDSTLIGNSNTIAALANSRRLEILQIYSANAEPWESGKQTYVNNCCSYENDLYWREYDWNLTAAPTASNSWWVKIEGPNDITTAMFEPTISNNFGAGSYNLLLAGSNQVNIGSENITSGHNATAIGEGLRAKTSQFVIGRFNEELDGTNGLSADNIDSTSGTLFIVGNGRHKISDYRTSAVERSNAMIVSADGTVSARRFVSEESTPIWTSGNISTLATSYDVANNMVIRIENNTVNDFIIFNITGLSADEVPNVSVEFINNQADCYPVFKNGNFELYCTDDTCYSGKSYMFRALGSMSEIIEMRTPRTNVTVNGTDVSVNGNLIIP